MQDLVFHRERTFRTTPGVHFGDISVPLSNGCDIVEHSGHAISPAMDGEVKYWYRHSNQIDNNRVIKGERLFELFFEDWEHPHWFVFLNEKTGALQIPRNCYHRSVSGVNGSLLINHAIRTAQYDEKKEFATYPLLIDSKVNPRYYNIALNEADSFIKHGVFS